MSNSRFAGVCIALSVALYLAYNAAMALHLVFVPTWPLWVCWLISGGVALVLMLFILKGSGNIYFEGIVVWVLVGSMSAYMASMPVSLKTKRLERVQQKYLQQEAKKQRDQELYQMMQAMRERQQRSTRSKAPQN